MKPTIVRQNLSALAIFIIVGLLFVGCKQPEAKAALGDSALLSRDADFPPGDRTVVATSSTDYKLDDNRYRQWTIAQQRLDALDLTDAPVRLTSFTPSAAEIDQTVAFLESRPDTRNALAASGLSARDYVLTTLALARANDATVDSDTENVRVLSPHRAEFDQVVSRSRFRIVDYKAHGKPGKGERGHGHAKAKGHHKGKH